MKLRYESKRYGEMFLTFLENCSNGDVLFQVDYADNIMKAGNLFTLKQCDAINPNVRKRFTVLK
jgi:hypothetical protein